MRWLLISPGWHEGISRPWVLLETPDRDTVFDVPPLNGCYALPVDEALADPRFGAAARAWFAGDDSAYVEDRAREKVECEAERILEGFD